MEIKELALLMWRGVRFLILGLAVGLALGVAATVLQAPAYEASTKVLVNRARQTTNSADVLPLSESQLVTTNVLLVKTKPVLDNASIELGVKIDPDNIVVTELPNTLIIQIKVQDSDSKQAAAIANMLVKILIQQNESILATRYTDTEKALKVQIADVQTRIDVLQSQFTQLNDASIQEQLKLVNEQTAILQSTIASLEQDINNFPVTLSVADKAALGQKQAQLEQLRSLLNLYQQIQVNLTFTGQPGLGGATRDIPSLTNIQSSINLYQQIYLGLQNSLEQNNSDRNLNTPTLLQIDPAVPPKTPVRPLPLIYLMFGGILGVALAAAVILLQDHLANPLKTSRQIEELLGLPVVGVVSEPAAARKALVTLMDPQSADAEAFRALGAGISLARPDQPLQKLLIANAGEQQHQTAIASNLAVVYAQQGQEVVLLDGDVRHPHLHGLFAMENAKGLADMVNGGRNLPARGEPVKGVECLSLVPAGVANGDSMKWLDAEKWKKVLSDLQEPDRLVIVDGPSPETADAQTLASTVDGILLVVKSGQTSADAAQATLRRFQLAGAKVLGVIFYQTLQSQFLDIRDWSWARRKPRKKEEHATGGGTIDEAPSLQS